MNRTMKNNVEPEILSSETVGPFRVDKMRTRFNTTEWFVSDLSAENVGTFQTHSFDALLAWLDEHGAFPVDGEDAIAAVGTLEELAVCSEPICDLCEQPGSECDCGPGSFESGRRS